MMWRFILIGLALALVRPLALAQPDARAILEAYLPVKDALVRSAATEAAKYGTALLTVLDAQPDFPEKAALIKATQSLARATDIEKQRTAFADMSAPLWAVLKRANVSTRDLYYAYCPMKKAYWISADAAIKNPYYGSKMLTCGNVTEKRLR